VAQRHREAAIQEVADLKRAMAVLRGGDGHAR
jgi:hypothetical protein